MLPDDFTGFEPPVELPYPDGHPGVGTVTREEWGRAERQYADAIPILAEPRWRAAAEQLHAWFTACRQAQRDLVVFYS
uniref:DUF7691 family protein n=1 Tax=Couchioplanes caeruleus TaxID=56438 RepID=UPI000F4B92A0|nr:hypothetical protein [Couchioplanes caeruleus]